LFDALEILLCILCFMGVGEGLLEISLKEISELFISL
jgi:hypothetical protein